jgi:hypothetical protein
MGRKRENEGRAELWPTPSTEENDGYPATELASRKRGLGK